MFSKMSKRELAGECEQKGIPVEGLDKAEMVRRLKAHDRKVRKAAGNEEVEEQSDGEIEVEASGIVPDGRADELRMRLALIEAEERRMAAERERIEASRAAEREADERRKEADERRMEGERLKVEATRAAERE